MSSSFIFQLFISDKLKIFQILLKMAKVTNSVKLNVSDNVENDTDYNFS